MCIKYKYTKELRKIKSSNMQLKPQHKPIRPPPPPPQSQFNGPVWVVKCKHLCCKDNATEFYVGLI